MMLHRLKTLIQHDARLQFRYGIYYAYAFVIAFYVGIIYGASSFLPDWVPALIVFTDPAVLGFFFLGALMMLEKSENVRHALAISPITPVEYFCAKAITLTSLSLIAITVLTPFLHTHANWPMLAAIVTLTSLQFVGIGIPAAFYFRSVTSYLLGAAGFLTPIVGPGFIALVEPMPAWAVLIPSVSQFRLILVATGSAEASGLQIIAMFSVAMIAAAAGIWIGIRSLEREMGRS